jgi:hypothetical protein
MNSTENPTGGASRRTVGWAAGLVAAGAIVGGVMAATLSASAVSTPAPSGTSTTATDPGARGHGGPGGQHPGETMLTGDNAAKAKAAALKAVPGGTIERVETDAEGAVYEAHMTKSDGSRVTVKFDKSFNVTAVEDGMGNRPAAAGSSA